MRTIGRSCILLFVFSLVLILPNSLHAGLAQEPPGQVSAVPLEPGTPLERAMGDGDVHAYQVTLDQGQFLIAKVYQNGVDVVVTVIGPNGEKIAEVDATGTAWIVTQLFDALLFVESTTSARPNPGGRRVGRALLSAPVNLDFEEGELGEPPTSWFRGAPATRLR